MQFPENIYSEQAENTVHIYFKFHENEWCGSRE